jgi:tetratricopeptide (TPR) repeat protein
MDRHTNPASLERLLLEPVSDEVLEEAVQHLWRCDRCWTAAVEIVNRRKTDLSTYQGGARTVLLNLVRGLERSTAAGLRAKALWADLQELTPSEQLRKIRSVASLQSFTLFEVIITDIRRSGASDPHAGEQNAKLAFSLAGLLPETRVPSLVRKDLEGEALTLLANCRRLMADWSGSFQAIKTAEDHLASGTRDSDREAMLLEIRSLLYMDTGNFDAALGDCRQAIGFYRQRGEWLGVARAAVIEASILLASGLVEEAIDRANLALGLIEPTESHLRVLSHGIIIESYLILERPDDALHLYRMSQRNFERSSSTSIRLRVSFLEARILDGIGSVRESEKLFRAVAEGFSDMGLHRDSFITLLTLFEAQCRRGALDKASRLCQLAIADSQRIEGSFNPQIKIIWQKLFEALKFGQIQQSDMEDARRFFIRYWNIPPKNGPKVLLQPSRVRAPAASSTFQVPPPPQIPTVIGPSEYRAARDAYDRTLVASALRETQGNISEASRRLGLSRMTLRARLRQYGLTPTGKPDFKG